MKFRFLVPLLFLLINCAEKDNSSKPLLHYVPDNSFLVVKIENHTLFINSIENNKFLLGLNDSDGYKQLGKKVHYLKYLSPKSESILALTETSANKFEFLYVTDYSTDLIKFDSIQNKTVENVSSTSSTIDKYTIENETFYSLKENQKMIISSSQSILENLEVNSRIENSEILQKLYTTNNKNKPGSIFINLNNSSSFLSTIAKENSEFQVTNFSDWLSLDLSDNQKNLSLSGVSIARDSTSNFIDLFAHTNPVTNKIASFAPADSDAILSYTFDNYNAFAKNRELKTNLVSPVEPSLDSVEEIGLIYTKEEKAIVLNTYGADGIIEFLSNHKKAIIEYRGLEILQLNDNNFLNNRFSPLISDYDANFCVLLNNAFVFSASQDFLKSIIRNYKSASTFNKTEVFKTINNEVAKESTILFVSNSKNIEEISKKRFSKEFSKDLRKINLSNYGFAAQLIADKDFYHTNVVVQKIGKETSSNSDPSPIYTVDLGGEIATNPQFVTNHKTGGKEIVVQDQNNVLSLISSKGKILWKKQLSSLVQGKVKQVDIFKNGRLQLAFTTNNQFLVLDRNGKEVEKFSKTYKGGNLNPLAVFDYDKKKNYRFVVTQGENTFMYNSKAEIVKGFKYTKAKSAIVSAPKHIVIGNKDFLVFKLKDGSLKLLNRVGNERIKVNKKIDFSENEVFKFKNKFSITNKKGVLHQVDLNGKVSTTNFNFSNDHGIFATSNTLVLMNDNVLTIKGKKIELELGVYSPPKIFYLKDKIYVSVTDIQNEKVYLFDSQAKSIKNFPIDGSSAIDLGFDENSKSLKLVVKESKSSISLFRL